MGKVHLQSGPIVADHIHVAWVVFPRGYEAVFEITLTDCDLAVVIDLLHDRHMADVPIDGGLSGPA